MRGFFDGVGGWLNAHFLGLEAAAIGLAAVVPLVVLLYFLKLKRKEQVISSTLLWQRALEDLRVNAPFQKLKTNLLLFLQLLILLALAVALARPFDPRGADRRTARFVLLVDQSASMSTRDADGRTRLESARRAALKFVSDVPGESSLAVISFAASPRVLSGFTSSKPELEAALARVQATGERTDLESALQVADGLAGTGDRRNCRLIVMSDAAIPESRPVKAVATEIELRRFGGRSDNAGITSLEARRTPAGDSQVFARVSSFAPGKTKRRVRLYFADRKDPAEVKAVELEPGARKTVLFEAAAPAGAVAVRVELFADDGRPGGDALPDDDVAWAVLPPERELKVLAYTADAAFLQKALREMRGTKVTWAEPKAVGAPSAAWSGFDAVIFDDCRPTALPPAGGYLFFNAAPPLPGAELGPVAEWPAILDWDRSHPVVRFASLEGLRVAKGRPVKLGRGQAVLLESEVGPLIAAWQHEQLRTVVVGFDIYQTNYWPFQLSFPVFIANAVHWLAEANPSWAGGVQRCGDPVRLQASYWPEAASGRAVKVELRRPDGRNDSFEVSAATPRLVADTSRAGVYRAVGPGGREALFACSVLDEAESDNAAREALNFAVGGSRGVTMQKEAATAGQSASGREFWKWAALAALAVFLLEWYVYNRRLGG